MVPVTIYDAATEAQYGLVLIPIASRWGFVALHQLHNHLFPQHCCRRPHHLWRRLARPLQEQISSRGLCSYCFEVAVVTKISQTLCRTFLQFIRKLDTTRKTRELQQRKLTDAMHFCFRLLISTLGKQTRRSFNINPFGRG